MKRPPELKTITPQAVIDFLPASIPEQLGVLDMCVQWLREDSEVVTQARMSEAKKHRTLTTDLSVANHKAAKLAEKAVKDAKKAKRKGSR